MTGSILLALHLLGAAAWVGGMAFALIVLRPSLAVLPPPQRLALHGAVFRRFFLLVWHAMPLVLLSGYGLLFGVYGGFAGVHPLVHLMHLLGLAMAAVFAVIYFGPWRRLQAALAGEAPEQAPAALARIRLLVTLNLALGTLTIVVAAFA